MTFLADLMDAKRARRGTRAGVRALTCRGQAILVLGWFCDSTTMSQLARDDAISNTTGYDYLHEGIDVLAARSPSLHGALLAAKAAGHDYVTIDGTLIATDRCSTPGRLKASIYGGRESTTPAAGTSRSSACRTAGPSGPPTCAPAGNTTPPPLAPKPRSCPPSATKAWAGTVVGAYKKTKTADVNADRAAGAPQNRLKAQSGMPQSMGASPPRLQQHGGTVAGRVRVRDLLGLPIGTWKSPKLSTGSGRLLSVIMYSYPQRRPPGALTRSSWRRGRGRDSRTTIKRLAVAGTGRPCSAWCCRSRGPGALVPLAGVASHVLTSCRALPRGGRYGLRHQRRGVEMLSRAG
ncbi:hypothetical protein JCM9534A_18350 [Catenuloplanes indicus JCM 9534]